MKNKLIKLSILGVLITSLTACWVTSDGQKTGIIVKFAKTGMFIKTYEAELIRGGFSGGSGVNGKSFHFTIEKKSLADEIETAFNSGKEVIIAYHEEAFTGCTRGETHIFLDSVKYAKE